MCKTSRSALLIAAYTKCSPYAEDEYHKLFAKVHLVSGNIFYLEVLQQKPGKGEAVILHYISDFIMKT